MTNRQTQRVLQIEKGLARDGGPFEIKEETVLGVRQPVFVQRPRSLRALLERSRDFGDKVYLISEEHRISYAEHFARVAALATVLGEQYGVGKGDRVAILAANCPQWVVSYFATVSLGAVAVGLNGWWSGPEIAFALQDSPPKVLLGDRKRLARIEGEQGMPVLTFEDDFAPLWQPADGADLPPVDIDEDDPACMLYTSGTTGQPRGALLSHRNLLAVLALQTFHGARATMSNPATLGGPEPCMLVTSPLFHVSGLIGGALAALNHGLRSVWPQGRFDPVKTARLIEQEKVTSWGPMGPVALRLARDPHARKHDLTSVTNLGSGGAPMDDEHRSELRRAFPKASPTMSFGYGQTECAGLATINFGPELVHAPYSVGRPLPTVELEIRDEAGRRLEEGQHGLIHVRGPHVMLGYHNRPEDTRAALDDQRWLNTGDFGRLKKGRLYIHARARDLILRGAENVYPAEIELVLQQHDDVLEAAVLGVDHADLGQEVKAIVVPVPGHEIDTAALHSWSREMLASFKVPAHWEVRTEPLPRNALGKVMKHAL